MNVNPNKGKGFWTFRLQKRRADGTWKTLDWYRTKTKREVRTLNVGRGTYRVVVNAKYGYSGTASPSVFVKH